jgi:hypothetical protein
MDTLRRILFWEYRRASWQYDVIVGVILLFIFVAPLYFSFGDQPKPASVAMVRGGYWIEAQQLEGVPEADLPMRAAQLVMSRYKARATSFTVEPIYDDEQQELKGYLAFPKP